jgi:hypothetical protein
MYKEMVKISFYCRTGSNNSYVKYEI